MNCSNLKKEINKLVSFEIKIKKNYNNFHNFMIGHDEEQVNSFENELL
jgi:hypothetical protein